jgi:hypothetical protein
MKKTFLEGGEKEPSEVNSYSESSAIQNVRCKVKI